MTWEMLEPDILPLTVIVLFFLGVLLLLCACGCCILCVLSCAGGAGAAAAGGGGGLPSYHPSPSFRIESTPSGGMRGEFNV